MSIPRKYSVLVVDDEPNGFAVIEALLHREGYDLFYVSSGSEALERLDAIVPDAILLDVMMPEMDGIEVCRRIKSDREHQHIPIIMVTALSSKEDLARCLEAGADDFISKPVNGLELRARVRSMLRLKQQYDALKATLQMREDMSNMVIHDLRNPVASILLSNELLLAHNHPQGKELQRLEVIRSSAQKLNSLINDLLMLAKMESGKLVLNPTKVDLNALATTVISDFQEISHSRDIRLEVKLSKAEPWILADANLIYRVLDNLLSNAVKFSPKGSTIKVRIDCPKNSGGKGKDTSPKATIQVIDEGSGVSEELQQRIFEKFETGSAIAGTFQIGLGLTFCKLVTEAHGGKISVSSNQPKGAIFTVELGT